MLKNPSTLHIDLISLLHFSHYRPPAETGSSFEEIAKNKAQDAARILQRWVIADDSGLVVPAISGQPGIYSRRYAGDEATDAENCKKLLSAMHHLTAIERSAQFVCALAIAAPDGSLYASATASCEGIIADAERGRNGFGYDPLFIKHETNVTFAEMDATTKNRISHRAKALQKLVRALEALSTPSNCS